MKGSLQEFMVSERDEQFHDLLERFVDVIVDTEGVAYFLSVYPYIECRMHTSEVQNQVLLEHFF